MNNKKSTKRALISSVLSLILCMSMLIGTTFAWFTDNVSSVNNIIQSGTLNVEMDWADGTEAIPTDDAGWTDASTGAIFNYDKWEPGYVEVRHIKISNEGTLALKYQLSIVANGEVSKLTDAIDVYYVDPAVQVSDRSLLTEDMKLGTLTDVLDNISGTASGELVAGENHTITLALKMRESAGNEYQGLSMGSDFSVKLFATQFTYEKDSFDENYDKMATIDDEAELLVALSEGCDLIELGSDIAVTNTIEIPAGTEVTIDLMGHKMVQANRPTTAYAMISNKGTLTISDSVGTGKISYQDINAYTADVNYAANTIRNEGKLNITGGTVENVTAAKVMNYSYPHAIDVYPGSETNISGGTVKSANYDAIRMFCNSTTVATTLNISGGNIVNRISFQNPNNNTHVTGYGVLNISGGNFTTTDGISANVRLLNFAQNYSNMKAVITGGNFDKGLVTANYSGGAAPEVKEWANVTGGTYDADPSTYVSEGYIASKNVGDTWSVVAGKRVTSLNDLKNAIESGAKVIDANGSNLGDFYYNAKFTDGVTVRNAKFTYFYGGNVKGTVTFENCEFVSDHSYSANFDSGNGNIIFNNCTFDGWSSFGDAIKNVEMNNCTFKKTYNYGILRFYQDAKLNNCVFEDSFEGIDTNVTGKEVHFNNCTGIEGKIFNNGSNEGNWYVNGTKLDNITSW